MQQEQTTPPALEYASPRSRQPPNRGADGVLFYLAAVAAAAAFASSVCLAAAYLAPAIMISGVMYGGPVDRSANYQAQLANVLWLRVLGWAFLLVFAIDLVLAVRLLRRRPPVA